MNAQSSGQALLLILLSVGVIITVAMSVVAKSVTDIGSTGRDEQSIRAFSAAEAGVEETLKSPVNAIPASGNGNVGSTGSYVTVSNGFPEDNTEYLYPADLVSGDVATVWLSSHTGTSSLGCGGANPCYGGNSIDVCWGKAGASVQPAIAATIIYDDASGNVKTATAAFDKNTQRASSNHFVNTGINNGCTIDGTSLAYSTNIRFSDYGIATPANHLKAIVFRVFYNTEPTLVGVSRVGGGATIPLQGRKIESTGAAQSATRKVQVYALYPEVPNIFHGAIYSPPGVSKN